MPSPSVRIGLLLCTLALLPAASPVRPAVVAASKPNAAGTTLANSTLDVPIEDIAASTNGCAILDKDFPGLRSHAMYGFFKTMSLHQIAALSHGRMTPDMLAQARSDLAPLTIAVPIHQADIDDLDPAPRGSHQ